jgi:two-component system response regulator AtoC
LHSSPRSLRQDLSWKNDQQEGFVTKPEISAVLETPVETGFVFGRGLAMQALNAMAADIAPTDIAVLVIGESGTGKEAYARHIYRLSGRSDSPLKKISCATLDSGRILSQVQESLQAGSSNGTGCVFLDGVEDLDLGCQRALASLLPDGEPELNEARTARLLCATSINLERAIEAGRFRRELYFRINGASLRLPPLRERKEDVPALVRHFLAKYGTTGKELPSLNSEAMELLTSYSWPGNIRELENIVKKMVALADTKIALSELRVAQQARSSRRVIEPSERKVSSLKMAARAASRRTERELILQALERTHWNRKRAAQELQISYKSLLYKIKQIEMPANGPEEL